MDDVIEYALDQEAAGKQYNQAAHATFRPQHKQKTQKPKQKRKNPAKCTRNICGVLGHFDRYCPRITEYMNTLERMAPDSFQ